MASYYMPWFWSTISDSKTILVTVHGGGAGGIREQRYEYPVHKKQFLNGGILIALRRGIESLSCQNISHHMVLKEVPPTASSQAENPAPAAERPSLQFNSGGYFLSLPPTPFCTPPEPPKFILLDDQNSAFYSIDYASPRLHNTTPWTALNLHHIPDAAIVFPPSQWTLFTSSNNHNHNNNNAVLATGFLVAIHSRAAGVITATKLGAVHVQRTPQEFMNWGALESLKGAELAAEMKAGLLRKVYERRRPGERGMGMGMGFVTPRKVLDEMPRQWHLSGAALNWELDQRFVGGVRVGEEQMWRLFAE